MVSRTGQVSRTVREAMLLTPERNQYKYLLNKCNHNEELKQYGWMVGMEWIGLDGKVI